MASKLESSNRSRRSVPRNFVTPWWFYPFSVFGGILGGWLAAAIFGKNTIWIWVIIQTGTTLHTILWAKSIQEAKCEIYYLLCFLVALFAAYFATASFMNGGLPL